jgi:antitoxin (DNA-binding transcriptional repressor) of toxin-antitoxin stability system
MEGQVGVVTIREFNGNVSKFIARAESGEVIRVARNGKIVAELRPPSLDRTSPEWKAAHQRLLHSLEEGISFGGPATYDERTR